jgi:crotonobetainyl-CoA hydratase
VPRAQLMETALGLAARIAGNAPLSVRASKRIALEIDGDSVTSEVADWARTAHEADVVRRSDDAREGPRAFAEKRDPIWTGR